MFVLCEFFFKTSVEKEDKLLSCYQNNGRVWKSGPSLLLIVEVVLLYGVCIQ